MKNKMLIVVLAMILLGMCTAGYAQKVEFKTLLPLKQINAITNEVSGSVPYNIMNEIAAFNRDRKAEEYNGTYWESKVITKYAKQFGYSDVAVESFPTSFLGRDLPQWDGEVGELWLVEPKERLIISHRDIPAALAEGSKTADVTSELIYVGSGLKDTDYEGKDVDGKIVLASGNGMSWGRATSGVYNKAVTKFKAAGVVVFQTARPYDRPDQIPWSGVGGSFFGGPVAEGTFGFNLPHRLGDELRNRILRGEKLKVRAVVKATEYQTDNEVPVMTIPGDGSSTDEVCLVAHLFEGVTKQGANDNISGCVAILEAGRTLIKLINEGKLPRPKRTIRFLHVPEIISSYQYLQAHPEKTKNIIAGINLDMVGEHNDKNKTSFHMVSSLQSLQSYLNDFGAHYLQYVYEVSDDQFVNRSATSVHIPIIDPAGSRDPFFYSVKPYSGGSDHIVFQMPDFRIPAIFLQNWPDMHYHTNEDRPDKSDPTQLKRHAFLAAVIAYTVANGDADDIPAFIAELSGRGDGRIGDDLQECLFDLSGASKEKLDDVYKECESKIYWVHKREERNLLSLMDFAGSNKTATNMINESAELFMKKAENERLLIRSLYENLCVKYGMKTSKPALTDTEKKAAKMIPCNLKYDKGLMGLFMAREKGIPTSMIEEFYNFVDGKMSVLDIRNAASAEFQPVKIEDVISFYEKYAEKNVLSIKKK